MLRLILPLCLLLTACGGDAPPAAPISDGPADTVPLTLLDFEFSGDFARALLQTPDGRSVAIPAEPCPAATIDLRLDDFAFPRPLTHDLLLAAAERLALPPSFVVLELSDGIPHAHIALAGGQHELVATIGDGLALHQRSGVPLTATSDLVATYIDTITTGKVVAHAHAAPAGLRRPPSARLAQGDAFVPMRMIGIVQAAGELAVVLVDLNDQRAFPFFIGFCQAAAINAIFTRLTAREASTHFLFHDFLTAASATVAGARIIQLREDTYIGELSLSHRGQTVVLDARPSDAVALALHSGAAIEIAAELLAAVGEDASPYVELFAAGKRPAAGFFPAAGNF